MPIHRMNWKTRSARMALLLLGCAASASAFAQAPAVAEASTEAAAELRFGDMLAQPIGPRGLAPSARLLALQGKTVRLVGYMAAAELPMPGRLILTAWPATLGDEDEHLADDLPANAVFVHLSGPAAEQAVPNLAGLMRVQGQLQLGAHNEADGHVSTIRLLLDAEHSARLLASTTARR
jgi:hypothetical protein